MADKKKSPDQNLIRGRPFFLVSSISALHIATGSYVFQAGLLTPGSIYLLRLPNEVHQWPNAAFVPVTAAGPSPNLTEFPIKPE